MTDTAPRSIRRRPSKWRVCNADAAVLCVEYGIEALHKRLTVDEVQSLARVGAEVADDEVYIIRVATNQGVECALSRRGGELRT